MKNRIEVKGKDGDQKEVTVYIVRPDNDAFVESQMIASATLNKAIRSKALLRSQLNQYMLDSGQWDEKKQKQVDDIDKKIRENLIKLKAGGIKLKEATDIAITTRALRTYKLYLELARRQLDEYTAESQADNAKFDYLVSVCTKDEEGNPYYKDINDYKNRSSHDISYKAASALASLVNNYDPDWEKKLPENQFLIKYNLVDSDLRLVNKDGHYVTLDNKKVDKNFNYVNDDDHIVDENGVLIDEDGLPAVESKPFLDDDDNPL